jgi:hypothetical protein
MCGLTRCLNSPGPHVRTLARADGRADTEALAGPIRVPNEETYHRPFVCTDAHPLEEPHSCALAGPQLLTVRAWVVRVRQRRRTLKTLSWIGEQIEGAHGGPFPAAVAEPQPSTNEAAVTVADGAAFPGPHECER